MHIKHKHTLNAIFVGLESSCYWMQNNELTVLFRSVACPFIPIPLQRWWTSCAYHSFFSRLRWSTLRRVAGICTTCNAYCQRNFFFLNFTYTYIGTAHWFFLRFQRECWFIFARMWYDETAIICKVLRFILVSKWSLIKSNVCHRRVRIFQLNIRLLYVCIYNNILYAHDLIIVIIINI